jgi:hypothetical protein
MTITFSELGNKGRLGNVLFQAATTIALALRNNDTYRFPKTWMDRKYFNISEDKFIDKNNFYYSQIYNEPNFHYNKLQYKSNLNLIGYFQSNLYFEDFKEEIIKILTPNIKVEKQNYTSLHIRRTDYLIHEGCYNILNRKNYYDRAIQESGGKNFLIFSDDIFWAKENFKGNEFNFAEGNNAVTDLALQLSCTGGNIIANSSFSWWGAYLNNNFGPVIYPSVWFGPKLSSTHNTKDLCPKEWIKV